MNKSSFALTRQDIAGLTIMLENILMSYSAIVILHKEIKKKIYEGMFC